jgi:dUTP pyrophosphatase
MLDEIKFARLAQNACIPSRKHPDDAGLDLYALEGGLLLPHATSVFHTGVTVEIPPGYAGLIKPKSRSNFLLGAGVVDAGYQGELLVKIVNPADQALEIEAGQAIAQLLVISVETPVVVEVPADSIHAQASARGASGGIHSG